jgi:peptidyl-prolyl cis-trans isomerase B (cyclophilin B)
MTAKPTETTGNPRAVLHTSMGDITVELLSDDAPETVANFMAYARDGHYHETVFHRVIPNFMIQGGGFDSSMEQKPTKAPIGNEADNGLRNERGTIAMARTSDPHSASSQFFINVANNAFLDHKGKTPSGWGYAVFGRVVEGMDVVDAIVSVPTGTVGSFADVPVEAVVIKVVTVGE